MTSPGYPLDKSRDRKQVWVAVHSAGFAALRRCGQETGAHRGTGHGHLPKEKGGCEER